jgi:hypothetical protein
VRCRPTPIGKLVLFGGQATGNALLGDTWTFDGTAWTQEKVPGPPAQAYAVMATPDPSSPPLDGASLSGMTSTRLAALSVLTAISAAGCGHAVETCDSACAVTVAGGVDGGGLLSVGLDEAVPTPEGYVFANAACVNACSSDLATATAEGHAADFQALLTCIGNAGRLSPLCYSLACGVTNAFGTPPGCEAVDAGLGRSDAVASTSSSSGSSSVSALGSGSGVATASADATTAEASCVAMGGLCHSDSDSPAYGGCGTVAPRLVCPREEYCCLPPPAMDK